MRLPCSRDHRQFTQMIVQVTLEGLIGKVGQTDKFKVVLEVKSLVVGPVAIPPVDHQNAASGGRISDGLQKTLEPIPEAFPAFEDRKFHSTSPAPIDH